MDIASVIGFALAASLLVISPGPNGLLIAKTVAMNGASAGFANIMGPPQVLPIFLGLLFRFLFMAAYQFLVFL